MYLRKRGRRPYLVPADVYRPAAIDQLAGIRKAADLGFHDVVVTINGYRGASLPAAREAARERGVALTVLAVAWLVWFYRRMPRASRPGLRPWFPSAPWG